MAPAMTGGRSNEGRRLALYDLWENGTISRLELNRLRDQDLVASCGLDEEALPLPIVPSLSEQSLHQQRATKQAYQQAAVTLEDVRGIPRKELYCSDLRCKAYISTNCIFRDRVAYCLRCGKKTCARCKEAAHGLAYMCAWGKMRE